MNELKKVVTGDEPAYPVYETAEASTSIGITKREFYAISAMQGICSGNPDQTPATIARWAVEQADALIAALNKDV